MIFTYILMGECRGLRYGHTCVTNCICDIPLYGMQNWVYWNNKSLLIGKSIWPKVRILVCSDFKVSSLCLQNIPNVVFCLMVICTVNSTSVYTHWALYRSYFKGISANIELRVYRVTCCGLYFQNKDKVIWQKFTISLHRWFCHPRIRLYICNRPLEQ
jgi:hypothetical protein